MKPPATWGSATTPCAAGSTTGRCTAGTDDAGRKVDRRRRARPVRPRASATAVPNPLRRRQLGAQPVRRPRHRHPDGHRDGAGRAAVRPVPGGLADEQRGRRATSGSSSARSRSPSSSPPPSSSRHPRESHEALAPEHWQPLLLLGTVAACGVRLAGRAPRAPRAASKDTTADRVRRGVAHGDLHRARQEVRGRAPRRDGRASASPAPPTWSPRSSRAPRPTCSPRPTPRTWTRPSAADLGRRHAGELRTNTLEIAVPPGQPGRGRPRSQDLAEARRQGRGLRPRGALRRGGRRRSRRPPASTIKPVSEEQSVTDVLARSSPGEADAGLVYVTDVEGGRRQGQGHRVPRVVDGGEHLPDRRPGEQRERRPGRGVRATWSPGSDGAAVLADAGFAKP